MIFKAGLISAGLVSLKRELCHQPNMIYGSVLFLSLVLTWIPIICSERRILQVIISDTKKNSNEDIGHHWRTRRESLKGSDLC